jgi:hypothetical protein
MNHYIASFLYSLVDYTVFYYTTSYLLPLNIKQKAHICSFKSSITMFTAGVYYNYLYYFYPESFNDTNTFDIGKKTVINFIGYLFTDSVLGTIEYPRHFTFLAGNIHHKFYIGVSIIALYSNKYNVYLMFMVSELPTILLNAGSINPQYRNDKAFGATFFITRIVYHFWLCYTWYNTHAIAPYACILSSTAHTFWFINWALKYL